MSETLKRTLSGKIVSAKMAKTVIVEVSAVKVHPKYHKRYHVTKKYPSHVEAGEYAVGDKVEIQECPPKSKTVFWKVVKKLN
jgi:small subunit ribosomal protein S17